MTTIPEKRLLNHGFGRVEAGLPEDAVALLGGMQAQDYSGAKWSTGLRLPDCSDDVVETAVAQGSIVRTWAMRGTLHFLAAKDTNWMLQLLAPRIISKNARRYRQLDLDEPTLALSGGVLARALDGGKELDRQALRAALEDAGINAGGQRLFYILQRAALDRLICQGTAPKNKPLYRTLPAAPEGDLMDREAALAALAQRYFASRGPATLDDFTWWSGLLAADARAGLEAAAEQLVSQAIDGVTYWSPAANEAEGRLPPRIMLLPGFDEYLVAYRDRSAVIDERFVAAWSRSKAMFIPSLVRQGQVIGLWKRTAKRNRVEIMIELFTSLSSRDREELDEAAEVYGRFLEKPVQLATA